MSGPTDDFCKAFNTQPKGSIAFYPGGAWTLVCYGCGRGHLRGTGVMTIMCIAPGCTQVHAIDPSRRTVLVRGIHDDDILYKF